MELMPAVEKINDLEKLRTLHRSLWTATSLAQVQALLSGKSEKRTE